MNDRRTVLIRVTGRDRPGITAGLLAILAEAQAEVHDMEQLVIRNRLNLDLLVSLADDSSVFKELLFFGWERDLHVEFEQVEPEAAPSPTVRHAVTVMAPTLTPQALGAVASAMAGCGANIDRIVRLSRYPVVCFEMTVSGGDPADLREGLVDASRAHQLDIAIQPEVLERRAKRLVVLDVDSTLIQDEMVDLLAEAAGVADRVRELTGAAMAGALDYETALRERVALLAGLPFETVETVRDQIRLTPGARTFIRTLKRLGYLIALVSGGFTVITDWLGRELGVEHTHANELEVEDGRLTGRLVEPVVDRRRKGELLKEIAIAAGIPREQVVAVGDGANDLDMLAMAGLGIAFNAKPVVRDAADTAVSVPYLDAILFVLGIRRDDIEQADRADPTVPDVQPIPVPGTPPV